MTNSYNHFIIYFTFPVRISLWQRVFHMAACCISQHLAVFKFCFQCLQCNQRYALHGGSLSKLCSFVLFAYKSLLLGSVQVHPKCVLLYWLETVFPIGCLRTNVFIMPLKVPLSSIIVLSASFSQFCKNCSWVC